jgi:hypothetical protein
VTLRCRQCPVWRDVHEVIRPLADDLGISDGRGRAAQNAELPISHLEAVTVGAVQNVAGPSLTKAGDVGDLIPQASRNEEPSRVNRTVAQHDPEAGSTVAHDLASAASDDLHAIALDLLAPEGEQLTGGQTVAREEPLHVRGGSVARRPGVDHGDPASCPAEHEGRTQASCAAADNRHVIYSHLHDQRVQGRPCT